MLFKLQNRAVLEYVCDRVRGALSAQYKGTYLGQDNDGHQEEIDFYLKVNQLLIGLGGQAFCELIDPANVSPDDPI